MSMPEAVQELTTSHARKLLRFLAEQKEALSPLLILTHDYPDPDALASAFAFQYLAETGFGIQTRIVYRGVIGRMENRGMVHILKIPARKLKSGDLRKYSQVALVDTQPSFENNPFPETRRAAVVIDQHPSIRKPTADFSIIDVNCGATSVILAKTLLISKMEIPWKVATALAYGILSDTLNLYRAGQPHIGRTYLDILYRCDLKALAKIQNPVRSRRFFATLAQGIQNAAVRKGLIASHLGFVENPDLVSQIADSLLTYKGMKWAVVTGRYKSKLYVSLRVAKPNVEAGGILRDVFANREDAGGHDSIAGGSFKVTQGEDETLWQEAEKSLIEKLIRRLRIPAKSEFYFPFRQPRVS